MIEIDGDIAKAETPPAELYLSDDVFARAKSRVFAKAWHYLGEVSALDDHRFVPWILGPGSLDVPIIVTRDAQNEIRAFSNVCTHRGNLVADAPTDKPLRCRYHGRRFDRCGKFVAMPEFDGIKNFPRPADDLAEISIGTWGPLIFGSLEPDQDFSSFIGPVEARVGHTRNAGFVLNPSDSKTYAFDANWALYVDNFLEGFHIPYVHPGLAEVIDYASYRTETFLRGTVQIGTGKPDELLLDLPRGHPAEGHNVAAYYFWLFPSTMLNFYPWGLSLNSVEAVTVSRTRVRFLSFIQRPELRSLGAGAEIDQVEMEDEEVVISVQRGLKSKLYTRGRYSPKQEIGVHHFHRLLVEKLFDVSG